MQVNSIKELILSVLKNYPIKKAAIFGSFARNEANDESDIDLLIEPSKSITIFDVLRLERDLSKVTSRKIDVVEYTAIKSSIRSNILKDAIVIL
jgi:predicted nucleotidyltransferase